MASLVRQMAVQDRTCPRERKLFAQRPNSGDGLQIAGQNPYHDRRTKKGYATDARSKWKGKQISRQKASHNVAAYKQPKRYVWTKLFPILGCIQNLEELKPELTKG